jgi:hypothetical protein
MKIDAIVWGLAGMVALSGTARSQSLADVARKEAERRKAITAPSKVYTDEDLRRFPVPPPPEPQPSDRATAVEDVKAADAVRPAGTEGQPPVAPAAPGTPAKPAAPSGDRGEQYWRRLMSDARAAMAASAASIEAIKQRVNALTTEFFATDDSARRQAISADQRRALDEIDRLGQEMANQGKAIARIEADASKANVPPDWIR